MTPDDFISVAGRLAATANSEEAVYRTAVSRAYYGAFHLAASLLKDLGFSAPRTANVHVFVQHCLNGSGQSSACIAASLLGDLHAARIRADYQLDRTTVGTHAVAMLCVEMAHEIRTALLECWETPTREHVRTGIAAYLDRISG